MVKAVLICGVVGVAVLVMVVRNALHRSREGRGGPGGHVG